VWLTDTARKSLQPVGWIGSNGRTKLQMPSSLLDKFTNIEVSVQDVGQAYEFECAFWDVRAGVKMGWWGRPPTPTIT
jgi:hypothetical protein